MSHFQLPKPKTVNVDGITIASTCFVYDISQRKQQRLHKKINHMKEGIGHVKEVSVVKVQQLKEKHESMKKEQSSLIMVEESKDISESASEVLVSALSILAALENRARDEEEFSLAIQDAKASTVRINLIA